MNEYTDACRRHAQVGAKMKHNNQEIAAWAIKTQLRGVKFTKPVEITYTFFEPNRRRDKSNVAAFGVKVIEELADVENMTVQLRIIYDEDGMVDYWKQAKMNRLAHRMDGDAKC